MTVLRQDSIGKRSVKYFCTERVGNIYLPSTFIARPFTNINTIEWQPQYDGKKAVDFM
jgi:hypothetical protein